MLERAELRDSIPTICEIEGNAPFLGCLRRIANGYSGARKKSVPSLRRQSPAPKPTLQEGAWPRADLLGPRSPRIPCDWSPPGRWHYVVPDRSACRLRATPRKTLTELQGSQRAGNRLQAGRSEPPGDSWPMQLLLQTEPASRALSISPVAFRKHMERRALAEMELVQAG